MVKTKSQDDYARLFTYPACYNYRMLFLVLMGYKHLSKLAPSHSRMEKELMNKQLLFKFWHLFDAYSVASMVYLLSLLYLAHLVPLWRITYFSINVITQINHTLNGQVNW